VFAPNTTPDAPSPVLSGGLSRSQTVLRREGAERSRNASPLYEPQSVPSPIWSPDLARLPTPSEQPEVSYYDDDPLASMSGVTASGKTSSDSGQNNALDRWSQRRLQRLNTEQGFREQRQGGSGILSPPPVSDQGGYNSVGAPYAPPDSQPQPPLHQQPQPHPTQQPAYQSARTGQAAHPNAGLPGSAQPVSTILLHPLHTLACNSLIDILGLRAIATTAVALRFRPPIPLAGRLPPVHEPSPQLLGAGWY